MKLFNNWWLNICLVVVVAVLIWIFGPSIFIEAQFQKQLKQQATGETITGFTDLLDQQLNTQSTATWSYNEATPMAVSFQDISDQPVWSTPVSPEFGLVIPKIFANVSVTENVNPANPDDYQPILRQAGGVAHAVGSSVPGEPGTVYIFGHSTDSNFNTERFNAVFYLLKKLELGDLIVAYYQNQPFQYKVTEKKTVDPTDISDITNVQSQSRLVLQTCWPPGTTWKRLLIIAQLQPA